MAEIISHLKKTAAHPVPYSPLTCACSIRQMDPKSGNDTDIICSVILNHCADQRTTKHWSFGSST